MTNALRAELAGQNIRVAGLHVGYMDTDMAASVTAAKSDPADIARIAIDGVEGDLYEIVADEVSHQVQAALAGGVSALYPSFPDPRPATRSERPAPNTDEETFDLESRAS